MDILPHLIWAIAALIIVAVVLVSLKKLLEEAGKKKAELLETIKDALKKDVGISISIEIGKGSGGDADEGDA